jgi:hypothetical protein
MFFHLSIVYVYLVCHVIFLPWTSHKLYQNLLKLKSQFSSQFYFMKFYNHITTYFYQVKVKPLKCEERLVNNSMLQMSKDGTVFKRMFKFANLVY